MSITEWHGERICSTGKNGEQLVFVFAQPIGLTSETLQCVCPRRCGGGLILIGYLLMIRVRALCYIGFVQGY